MKPTVLFVDDEPAILRSLSMMFRPYATVLKANNGTDAVKMLEHGDRAIHVLVSDQRMPGMEGVDVLRHAKKFSPNTVRILLTGYADFAAIVGSVNDGEVYKYINKPWNRIELLVQVLEATKIGVKQFEDSRHQPKPVTALGGTDVPGVLIVDDDAATVSAVEQVLVGSVQLHVANTLEEAVELLRRRNIGLVITELKLDSKDTMVFIKYLKKAYPSILTLVLTSFRDSLQVVELINSGRIYRLLPKPIRFGLFKMSIERAIRLQTMV